ncbi:MAG: cysteine--tRNA ligase [bacterium]|nr:cysteine--tRNA ligase [bacterium]
MQIFNTLGRALENFEPRDPGKVGMYVCGATVQSKPHLGHGRYAVVFDVVRRYLAYIGYDVTYVRNVTDVDDKIIDAANAAGVSTQQIVDEAHEAFLLAYEKLGVLPADIEPRATEHIAQMITMIEQLIAGGHAYEAGGDVYFSVRGFPDYGKLSGRDVDELQSGARIAVGDLKRDPLDFALWKGAKPGEPSWPSPWGEGRPGWHIECSAMAHEYLGTSFDIHGGGNDLIFPHHENEIAQAEAALGIEPFARYWMHNGMMTLTGEKMSKSTGHIIDLLDAVEKYPGLAVRLFYLRTHYRKPLDFSEDALADASASLDRLWSFRRRRPGPVEDVPAEDVMTSFRKVMENDVDVAGAMGVLFDAVREGNRRLDAGESADAWIAAYDEIVDVLGLAEPARGLEDIADSLGELAARFEVGGVTAAALVDALVERRNQARAAKDWAIGDTIRDELGALGVVVEDGADGSAWHRR